MLNPGMQEPDDLRATIEASFEPEAPAAEADVNDEPAEHIEQEADSVTDKTGEPPAPKGDHPTDPARYADGTFKPTKAEAAPEKVEAPAEIPSTDPAKASTQPASTPVVAPPAGWTAAEKAEWSKLPPAVQAAVSRREAEISQGGKQWSEEKRRYEGLISPLAQEAAKLGLDPSTGLNALLGTHRALQADPRGTLLKLAQQYGVDLTTAGQTPDNSPQTQPDISALVRQAVEPYLAPIQHRFQSEDQQRQQSATTLVEQFAAQPGHEHFAAVEAEIMDLIPGVKARNPGWDHQKILQEAYDRAVYANPETRAAMLAAKDAAAEAKRVADAKARATNARRAGASVTGSPNGAPSTEPADTLRGEIERAFSGS